VTSSDAGLDGLLARWGLDPDGPARRTPSSVLAPVRRDGAATRSSSGSGSAT
jgi:streptomycin 6-kinase